MMSILSRVHVTAVLAALAGGPLLAADAARKPNVLVIVADDLGYADLGFQGCKDVPTPNLDALARGGIRCSSGYVSGPYCSPTRAGLLTGRYQQRYGHEFNPGAPNPQNLAQGLSLKETTLADRLKAAGYRTGLVGKWHLGHAAEFRPQKRGFEEFFGFLGGAHSYLKAGAGDNAIFRGNEPANEKEYLTDAFGREAVAFIDRHAKEPFYLQLTFNAVHGPLEAADKYLKRFPDIKDEKRQKYAGMLSAMDDAVGAVVGKLRSAGVEDNTLVVFLSDNGGPEQVNASDNGPLHGGKATTWEGGVRVPFVLHWKAGLPAGKVYDQPLIQLDVLPTVLAAAGVSAGEGAALDGVNLLPYLRGEKAAAPHEALYWRFGGQMAVRAGDWKLVKAAEGGGRAGGGGAALRREKATVEGAKLFNLRDDIGEATDLAAKQPEKVKELAALWQAWDATLVPPAWGPPARQAAAAK
jgi:arylsulfatase A-like enzyme